MPPWPHHVGSSGPIGCSHPASSCLVIRSHHSSGLIKFDHPALVACGPPSSSCVAIRSRAVAGAARRSKPTPHTPTPRRSPGAGAALRGGPVLQDPPRPELTARVRVGAAHVYRLQ
eukprot:2481680-Prymnesium_polylepis.1